MINDIRFSIIEIRISVNFMHLSQKLTLEMCQKVWSLDGKGKQNRLKAPTLPTFSQKTVVFIEKRKTLIDFLL